MTHDVLLFLAAFLACAVEMVEATTIILAVGLTQGWRPARNGALAAVGLLAVIVAAAGPAIARLPLSTLRVVVGTLLLLFGLQWLRKAILRAAGVLPQRDETAAFARATGDLAGRAEHRYGFVLAFKGVFLEGLEVAFIVVTFGGAQRHVSLAAIAALAALVVVAAAAGVVRAPLARVPENALKFAVGVLLTTFGVFWSGEGLGVHWPGSDGFLLALLGVVLVTSLGLSRWVRVPTTEGLA